MTDRLKALIFDVDGTLAETEELHRRAFNETFAEAGLPWQWDRARYGQLLKTTGGKERMRRHADDTGFDIADTAIAELHRAKTARYGALMAQGEIALRPGIAALIDRAKAAGIAVAVATTTNRPNVDALCEATFGQTAGDVFAVIAAGDEVAAKKPAPDVFLLALERLGLPASSCIAFEDSANGLRSAIGARLATIVCPSGYTETENFTGAALCIDSYEQLVDMDALAALLGEHA